MPMFDGSVRDFDALRTAFRWQVPEFYNVAHEVCDRHTHLRDTVALYCENAAGEQRTVTFGQLKELSNRFANVLRAKGVRAGDRVAIVLPQRAETAIAHLAAYKLGAVAVPLSVLFGPDALRYRLADSEARAVICDGERFARIEPMGVDLPALNTLIVCGGDDPSKDFWSLLDKASASLDPVYTRADDAALLIYTSGTTGPPKGALVAHRALLGNAPGFELSQNFFPQQDDLFWTPADWAWTGGLWDGLLPTLYYGKPILAYEGGRFDPERVCALLARYSVRNAFIPPTALRMLRQLDDVRARFDLRLRSVMSAGEAVGAELYRWAKESLGVEVNEMWGQTEFNYLVGNCSAIMPVRPGAMGKPYPGHDVDVIDEHGRVLAPGEVGELAARTNDPVMYLGYWKNEQAGRAKLLGGWFRTGDVGYRDEDGYLWFVGRNDDVISSAGYRIGPGEIEDSLLKHPSVAQAAAVGVPDELRGSVVKAYIVLNPGYDPSTELATAIQTSVRTNLAAYEYPRQVEFIDEMPMTTTGKIRRIELRNRS